MDGAERSFKLRAAPASIAPAASRSPSPTRPSSTFRRTRRPCRASRPGPSAGRSPNATDACRWCCVSCRTRMAPRWSSTISRAIPEMTAGAERFFKFRVDNSGSPPYQARHRSRRHSSRAAPRRCGPDGSRLSLSIEDPSAHFACPRHVQPQDGAWHERARPERRVVRPSDGQDDVAVDRTTIPASQYRLPRGPLTNVHLQVLDSAGLGRMRQGPRGP